MIIYVSGKYTGKTPKETNKNIAEAKAVAIELWNKGFTALCPHLNTANFEDSECHATYKDYLRGDIELLSRCDAMVLCKGWQESNGALLEVEFAKNNNIPIYEYPNMPLLLETTNQDLQFASQLMIMYRVYLRKSRDYSTANILGTGEIGVCVRLWDKMARLMNLTGFELKVEQCEYEKVKIPNYESIIDTCLDMANYSIIGILLKNHKWGDQTQYSIGENAKTESNKH